MSIKTSMEKVSLVNKTPHEIYQHVALQKLTHDYLVCRGLSPESYESLKTAVAHMELMALSCVAVALRKDKEMFEEASKTLTELVKYHIQSALEILNGKDKQKESML